MALANLFNVFRTPEELAWFSFTNNDEHVKIANAILAQYEIVVPIYILDPIPEFAIVNWLETHQTVHNYMNSVLSLSGNDLSEVDFKNMDQVASWTWLHAQEHYNAANTLGLK